MQQQEMDSNEKKGEGCTPLMSFWIKPCVCKDIVRKCIHLVYEIIIQVDIIAE